MRKTDFNYLSADKKTTIHATFWEPEQEPVAILQIAHGITEYIDRYQNVAEFFVGKGFAVGGNDHLGHGQSMDPDKPLPGYFGPKGSWKYVEEDVKTCALTLKKQFPGIPHILLGFSLGSFVARCLLGDNPELTDMDILAGTGQMKNAEIGIAQRIVGFEERRQHDDTKDTPLIHKLSMETYNRKYAPCRTEADWLCANPDAQDAYIADPQSGDGFTVSSFRELLSAMKACSAKEHLSRMNPAIPVLFVSGKDDAVGNFGKGVQKAAGMFKGEQFADVTVKLFDGMRHDVFREKKCQEVYEYIYRWIEKRRH
ncbi:MAG: alpha/beta hydrolase [Clostridiales bacterium]|nr:alpha/beta hydrolase [Clostridiales bacterium]